MMNLLVGSVSQYIVCVTVKQHFRAAAGYFPEGEIKQLVQLFKLLVNKQKNNLQPFQHNNVVSVASQIFAGVLHM